MNRAMDKLTSIIRVGQPQADNGNSRDGTSLECSSSLLESIKEQLRQASSGVSPDSDDDDDAGSHNGDDERLAGGVAAVRFLVNETQAKELQ